MGDGEYDGGAASFMLMHVAGSASSDRLDAIISHDSLSTLAALHDHLRS
jgi:hypothetical protein